MLDPAARAAIDSLSPKDKKAVLRSLTMLEMEEASTVRRNPKIHKLSGEEKYYLLRVNLDLRIIFEFSNEETISVIDVVRHSQLERFYKRLYQ